MLRQAVLATVLLGCTLAAWAAEPMLWVEGEKATFSITATDSPAVM